MRRYDSASSATTAAAERAGFEVLITVDRNLSHQQSLQSRGISLVVLQARSTIFDALVALIPDTLRALKVIKPGDVVRIGIR